MPFLYYYLSDEVNDLSIDKIIFNEDHLISLKDNFIAEDIHRDYKEILPVGIKREQLGNLLIALKLNFDIKIDGEFILVKRENDKINAIHEKTLTLHNEIFT